MNFVNFWMRDIVLALGATACPLDLPDGDYRLVVADGLGAQAAAWEIIDATVVDGAATLTRGLEGTGDQAWPIGSVIYSSVTAELLEFLWDAAQDTGGGGGVAVGVEPPSGPPASADGLFLDVAGGALFASVDTSAWGWQQVGGGRYMERLEDDGTETAHALSMYTRNVQLEAGVYAFDGAIRLRLPPLGGGLGVLETMQLEISNPDSTGWQLQLDCSDIADRMGLSAFQFEASGADTVVDGNMLLTLGFTGSRSLQVAVGLLSEDGSDRTALVRIVAAPLSEYVSINSPISF